MSTISGRHLKKPLSSTYFRHLQVLPINMDIFWRQILFFCTFPRENAEKMSFFVGGCVLCVIYIYILTYDSAFFQHKILVFRAFSP